MLDFEMDENFELIFQDEILTPPSKPSELKVYKNYDKFLLNLKLISENLNENKIQYKSFYFYKNLNCKILKKYIEARYKLTIKDIYFNEKNLEDKDILENILHEDNELKIIYFESDENENSNDYDITGCNKFLEKVFNILNSENNKQNITERLNTIKNFNLDEEDNFFFMDLLNKNSNE